MNDEKYASHTDVTQGLRGWFAVLMVYYDDIQGFDVFNSGISSYVTREEAIADAKSWAELEGLKCRAK